jgi:hypothetical protein
MDKTRLNVLRCTRAWLWLERLVGRELLPDFGRSKVERAGDYISYGENEKTPGCRCRPTNVLYWELSEADTTNCPVHWEQPFGGRDG